MIGAGAFATTPLALVRRGWSAQDKRNFMTRRFLGQTMEARRLGIILATAALLLPFAQAGTAESPEFSDTRDVQRPMGDILAVWVQDHPQGLKFTFKIVSATGPTAMQLFSLVFSVDGRDESAAIGWDRDRRLHTSLFTRNNWGNERSTLDDALVEAQFLAGTPAYLTAVIPRARIPELGDGARVTLFRAESTHYDGQQWVVGYDEAEPRGTLFGPPVHVMGGAGTLLDQPGAIPLTLLVATAGGAAVGWRFSRRGRSPRAR